MGKNKSLRHGIALALLALLFTAIVIAQSGGTTILWDSLMARGRSTASGYTLSDSIGEPFGGVASGGGFTLRDGGPLGTAGSPPLGGQRLYLPTILRGN